MVEIKNGRPRKGEKAPCCGGKRYWLRSTAEIEDILRAAQRDNSGKSMSEIIRQLILLGAKTLDKVGDKRYYMD